MQLCIIILYDRAVWAYNGGMDDALSSVVKDHVLDVLSRYRDRKTAAMALGITERTIRNYLHDWGMMGTSAEPEMIQPSPDDRDEWNSMDKW